MPVVVGDFEVLPAAAPAPKAPASSSDDKAGAKEPVTPCAVAAAMRSLEAQALRAWAH
jgi:hypothetical protein